MKLIITDLDGTLFNDKGDVSEIDVYTLEKLGKKKIFRAIATGRSLFSFKESIPRNFPIDYLIFSSGGGLMNWKTQTMLETAELTKEEVVECSNILMEQDIDFMIHEPIPENHKFFFYNSGCKNPDFKRRLKLYAEYGTEMITENHCYKPATQVLAIVPENGLEIIEKLRVSMPDLNIIRTTSPLDKRSTWIEIFPKDVSKGHTAMLLADRLEIDPTEIAVLGNDYNDLELLEITDNSYVVENAPEDLKERFMVVASNNDSGFTEMVEQLI
ncbi:MAG: HAD-IIB family hydrolase [Candidatus Cloacimonetes bacterium]|nr:HAD-IIB family hydrolase [Candidatus Cloacimonadota bacterium]